MSNPLSSPPRIRARFDYDGQIRSRLTEKEPVPPSIQVNQETLLEMYEVYCNEMEMRKNQL